MQRTYSAAEFPNVMVEYIGEWYYPRLPSTDPDSETDVTYAEEVPLFDLDRIKKALLNYYPIPWETIIKRSRKRELVQLRMRFMYFLRFRGKMTYVAIGDIFAMDHTSVIHGVNTIKHQIEIDRTIRKEIEYLNSLI